MPGAELDPYEVSHLKDNAKRVMKQGSLSFMLASRLLGADERTSIFLLYRWFRHCDDVIDGSAAFAANPLQTVQSKTCLPVDKAHGLAGLREESLKAFEGSDGSDEVFQGFGWVMRKHRIPFIYVDDFLKGMEMDVQSFKYETAEDLCLYAYRVAGTVGLLCSHIFGLRGDQALEKAAAMGMAMQFTNIARDVAEDYRMGRIYLPATWLEAESLPKADLLNPLHVNKTLRLIKKLVNLADGYYVLGASGLADLPWRAGLAVAAARRIYQGIGDKAVSSGKQSLIKRTWMPLPMKLWFVFRSIGDMIATIPFRLRNPWQARPIERLWRYP